MKMKTMFRLAAGCIISGALMLTGCGGSGGGPAVPVVTGTASEGALITDKTVKLKDADGKSATDTTTDHTTGVYTVNVSGLKAPFLITVTGINGTYVSLAPAAGTANINPITTTVVALAAGSSDPAALFANLKAADVSTISANYAAKAGAVTTALAAALPTGVSANDYFTGTISAGKGMDSVFDSYRITVTPTSGIVVKTKDASETTVLSVPTVSPTVELPVVTKISTVSLTADKSSTTADKSITITADVKIAGNVAPDNTTVTFTTDAGTLSAATATTINGKASVTLTASAALVANVHASVNAAVLLAPVKVTFTAAPTYAVTLAADKTSATAGGSITLTADVTYGGATAADGTVVTFATSGGGTLSAPTATTASGKASVTVTSSAAATPSVTATVGTVHSSALGLTFTAAIQYSQAVLKLKTTGTLPGGSLIGAWGVTMQYPASGLSIKTKSVTTTALDKTAFFQSGVANPVNFTFTYVGSSNTPDSTSTVPYLLLGSLGDVTDATNGMNAVGEIATIVFDIAAGAATPTKSSFVLSNKKVYGIATGGQVLTTVDLDFDLTLK